MSVWPSNVKSSNPWLHLAEGKRSRLKPLLARLHREFNISVAEVDRNDAWKEA
jgi:uncharacterized protein YlxP (DUF503 family)